MRRLMFAFWLIGILTFAARETVGQCKCAYNVPGSKYLSAHEALKTSTVVFTGKIIEVKKGTSPNEYDLKFMIKSAWKKDVVESIVLRTYRVSCGFFGEKGKEYLVYAFVRDGMLTTHGCTRTKPLDKAAADLKEFEAKGEKPAKIIGEKSIVP